MARPQRKTVWQPLCSLPSAFEYTRGVFSDIKASTLSKEVDEYFPIDRPKIRVFGKMHKIPRDQIGMSLKEKKTFMYSGSQVETVLATPLVKWIWRQVEIQTNQRYSYVLINRYVDGKDGVGWHGDDLSTLDRDSPIASVSIGATRRFYIRETKDKTKKWRLNLENGDLVVMTDQINYQHTVPKQAHVEGVRYNLTFRVLKEDGVEIDWHDNVTAEDRALLLEWIPKRDFWAPDRIDPRSLISNWPKGDDIDITMNFDRTGRVSRDLWNLMDDFSLSFFPNGCVGGFRQRRVVRLCKFLKKNGRNKISLRDAMRVLEWGQTPASIS